eukprot:scaffold36321_cov63-Attheya_sp.AAC.4
MAEPTALRLHDNRSFPDQLGYAVHQTEVQTMAHLKVFQRPKPKCAFLERYGVNARGMEPTKTKEKNPKTNDMIVARESIPSSVIV